MMAKSHNNSDAELAVACSANPLSGAFAEYITCPRDLVWRIPDSMSFEEAATVSLCGLTAAQSLFYRLNLPAPFKWQGSKADSIENSTAPQNVFIYGASTSVGLFAAKLLRLSSREHGREFRLLGAASPAQHAALKNAPYGYDVLVDYRAADWVEQLKAQCLTTGGVAFAMDCISEGSSVEKVSRVLAEGGRFAVVRSRAGKAWGGEVAVEPVYGAVWEGLGERVEYQGKYPPPLYALPLLRKVRVCCRSFRGGTGFCRGVLQVFVKGCREGPIARESSSAYARGLGEGG